jgi:serine phosphatase RsbU (regulator of sigma subunit)/flagellin-specific chaperone FliS
MFNMKSRNWVLAATIALLPFFSGCRQQQTHQEYQSHGAKHVKGNEMESFLDFQDSRADSLVLATYKEGDHKRVLAVIDSLSAAGELNEFRTEGYRATIYKEMNDAKNAIASLRRAIEVKKLSGKDYFLMVYLKTLYAEQQQMQGNSEGALRTALPLVEQMQKDGHEDNEVCQRLYSVIGELQLNLDHPDEAAKYFERLYGILKKSIRNDSTGNHLMEAVETLNNVTSTYLGVRQWDEAEFWLHRLDSVFTLYKATPCAAEYPSYIDWYRAYVDMSHAMIAEVSGKKDEAQQYYNDFQATDYSKSDEGRLIGCNYLMLSQRYAEAADNFTLTDKLLHAYDYEPNLQVIGNVLIPKLRANYYAGRKDSALCVAMQIAEQYDTALARQRRDATAEMATIYDVEGKERMIAEREAEISHQRLIGVTILLVGLVIFFVIFTWVRNRMAKMKAKQERIEGELGVARNIQMSMVPSAFPQHKGLDMYAMMTPAKEVGGDLYGYLLQGDKLYFCLGDVSGKGVPASLFMAQVTRLFRTLATQNLMPADICSRINDAMSEDNDLCMFVTLFVGLLDLNTGHLDFCNAGHNPPVIDVGNSRCDFLKVNHNVPIGPMPGMAFKGEEIDSIKGRPLFIYTDGLNEAENNHRQLLGNDRMLAIIQKTQSKDARQLIESMAAEVEKHRDGAEPNDDLTMMAIYLM